MSAPVNVFFSYAPADELSRQELEKHLSMLQRSHVIRGWSSRQVGAGEEWRNAIDSRLEAARVILLLVSADFLASDYCFDVEITRAIARAEAGEAHVLAVLVRAYDWGAVPFGSLPVLPADARPVESWSNRDEAWANVARGIREAVEQFTGNKRAAPARAGRTPRYSDARSRILREQIDDAKDRADALRRLGRPAGAIEEEIRGLRNKLREGGLLRAGDSLGDGRYLLIEPLGRGGFAWVWLAEAVADHHLVAIKVLHGMHSGDASRRARFFRGAREMAGLKHSAVVRVVEAKAEDGGFFYFVMEYIAGEDLRKAVLGKRLPSEEVLPLILRVGEALAEAHAKGVLHRDVKPANILLDVARAPRLTDFDLVAVEGATRMTEDGALGTFGYSAPEMMTQPGDADARADVYGLAMTTIFCLAGAEPDQKELLRDTARYVTQLPCGEGMKRVLTRAVEWDKKERYADACALCDALREAGDADAATAEKLFPSLSPKLTTRDKIKRLIAPPPAAAKIEHFAASSDHGERQLSPLGQSNGVASRDETKRPLTWRLVIIAGTMSFALGVGGVCFLAFKDHTPPEDFDPPKDSGATIINPDFQTALSAVVPSSTAARCPGGMLLIPAATFKMGSLATAGDPNEHPQHTVKLSSYCMDRTEVTVEQYTKCATEPRSGLQCPWPSETVQSSLYSAKDAKSASKRCNGKQTDYREKHPINCVNWNNADTYCRWSDRRLPTEAEWEYGAGGGARTYPWAGEDEPGPTLLNALGGESALSFAGARPMYKGNDGWAETAPVGSYPASASPFGLLDMAGNVWEWTSDWYEPYPSTPTKTGLLLNPQGPEVPSENNARVLRGGGWGDSDAAMVRVTHRFHSVVSDRFDTAGFRCARKPQQ